MSQRLNITLVNTASPISALKLEHLRTWLMFITEVHEDEIENAFTSRNKTHLTHFSPAERTRSSDFSF